ncbi:MULTISPECIES: acyl-CoA dehydrogenase family protein [Cupriavidus]|uniref:Acyl-CoA/acyl-ACP dehydrogenase n=1 Tax=Cupriavidus campinensis TaxID=151783 RepID=A0AAE9IBJ9_9BURK|nr:MULTISPECIES: acyl-CoA dehydrogenase family protein [Cupriavidus]URF07536.1 acyl-CoA/acyl-ACP dehydrogenase [Cupriavidus campinensis]
MNELERMLADSASRLFADAVTPARIDAMEHGLWPAELWDQVEASGLTRLFVPEADEGAQASWTEGLPVLLAGANAPAPFLDTVVAGWVLNQLGVSMPGGPIGMADLAVPVSACLHGDGWELDSPVAVPWGRYVGHVLIRAIDAETKAPLWLLAATGAAAVETGVNLANEPRDRLTVQRVPDSAAVRGDPAGWPAPPQALGALTRAIGIAGLLERILNQTVQYANERTQFGRPIGKFQAVQQQLAILANETVAARMAVASACAAVDAGDWTQAAMVAKVICGQSAGRAAAIAHQVHGAIGFTHEHSLHQSTRRVWAWRAECGTEAYWAAEIGRRAIARGGDALWADLTTAAA